VDVLDTYYGSTIVIFSYYGPTYLLHLLVLRAILCSCSLTLPFSLPSLGNKETKKVGNKPRQAKKDQAKKDNVPKAAKEKKAATKKVGKKPSQAKKDNVPKAAFPTTFKSFMRMPLMGKKLLRTMKWLVSLVWNKSNI